MSRFSGCSYGEEGAWCFTHNCTVWRGWCRKTDLKPGTNEILPEAILDVEDWR